MNRINQTLNQDKKLLSIYFTAGFPQLEDTVLILEQLQEADVGWRDARPYGLGSANECRNCRVGWQQEQRPCLWRRGRRRARAAIASRMS